jgi:2-hydroxychromene-2-carboxylate isomerase
MSSRFPVNALKAMRLIVAAEASEKNAALALALFRAVWVDDRDVTAEDELRALAGEVGLDGGSLLAAVETQEVKDKLRAYTDQAIARGVFGAPALLVGSELFWGNDRLHFVEEALRSG